MSKRESVTAPSGKVYEWTQPPRHVHWKHGRAGRTFAAKMEEIARAAEGESEPLSDDEKGARVLEAMSDAELSRLEAYADAVLTAGLGHPPGDMPDVDYWYFFGRSVYGIPEQKVETAEGETTVEAVDNFREESGVSSTGEDVPDVRAAAVGGDGDTAPAAV